MNEDEKLIKALEYCTETGKINCEEGCPYFTLHGCQTEIKRRALKLIKKLRQSNKEGEWVFAKHDKAEFYKCSECDHVTGTILTTYCPKCGAKMTRVRFSGKVKAYKVMT